MRAAIYRRYGSPSEIQLRDMPVPQPAQGQVLVRVAAAGVNPGDWYMLAGTPYVLRLATGLSRPKQPVLGLAVAGEVAGVGSDVQSDVAPGQRVFAEVPHGGFAEYAVVDAAQVAPSPTSLDDIQAAAVPVCGVTALQALRDVAAVENGQDVFITGASGGVGSFAVQIAAAMGATVTAECSGTNAELVRSLGAAAVIDYTTDSLPSGSFDVVLDNVGRRPLRELRGALRRNGLLIPNANHAGGFLGHYVTRALQAAVTSPFVPQTLRPFSSKSTRADLVELSRLIDSGVVAPEVDEVYPLERTAEALSHYGTGHSTGKVIVSIDGGT